MFLAPSELCISNVGRYPCWINQSFFELEAPIFFQLKNFLIFFSSSKMKKKWFFFYINLSTILTYPQDFCTDGANGDRCIDISMITFTYGANGNKFINLSTLSRLSNYRQYRPINNIDLSTILPYPQYWTFLNIVFFYGAINPRSCLIIILGRLHW